MNILGGFAAYNYGVTIWEHLFNGYIVLLNMNYII